MLAIRLTLPPLVGYLIAGYVLHIINITPLENLNYFAEIGIQLLLFTVGLKLKPSSLIKKEVLFVGSFHLLVMAVVSAISFLILDNHLVGGVILGLSLAFSSTIFAIKVLEDKGELSSLHGRGVLSILILQDLVAIALLAFAENKNPSPWAFSIFLLPFIRPLVHRILSYCTAPELKLLLGVLAALSGGILAESVGISADIGALLAGITLANHPSIDELSNRLWSIKELFLLILLPAQGILFFFLFTLAKLRARTAFVAALALMTYSEFALITTTAVIDAKLLPSEWQSIISLAVACSLIVAAPLNRHVHTLFSWLEPLLIKFERRSLHTDRLPDSFGATEWLVVGMGRTGVSAYQTLTNQGQRVIGLDSDPTVLETHLNSKRRVVYADIVESEIWGRLPLEKIKGVVLTLPSYHQRINAIKKLRKNKFCGLIGSICYLVDDEKQLLNAGATFVIHPMDEAGKRLAEQILIMDI